jgi:hypothetical protein
MTRVTLRLLTETVPIACWERRLSPLGRDVPSDRGTGTDSEELSARLRLARNMVISSRLHLHYCVELCIVAETTVRIMTF